MQRDLLSKGSYVIIEEEFEIGQNRCCVFHYFRNLNLHLCFDFTHRSSILGDFGKTTMSIYK